jgi:hypothetical protein
VQRKVPALSPHRLTASLVTYKNSPHQIERLLRSLRASRALVQIAVFDNSPDESLRSIVNATGALYLRTRKNMGFGAGHNHAIRSLEFVAPYHLVINPDIECHPDVIDSLREFMESHPEIGLVMPRILNPDGTQQHLCKMLPSPLDLFARRFLGRAGASVFRQQHARYHLQHLDLHQPREVPCLSGCFMFLRRAAIEQTGFFDERFFMYMEDVDLCRRIGERYKTALYPNVAVRHEYAKGSYKDLKLLAYHLQSAVRYFSKWGWFFDTERKLRNQRTSAIAAAIDHNNEGSQRVA